MKVGKRAAEGGQDGCPKCAGTEGHEDRVEINLFHDRIRKHAIAPRRSVRQLLHGLNPLPHHVSVISSGRPQVRCSPDRIGLMIAGMELTWKSEKALRAVQKGTESHTES